MSLSSKFQSNWTSFDGFRVESLVGNQFLEGSLTFGTKVSLTEHIRSSHFTQNLILNRMANSEMTSDDFGFQPGFLLRS
jgi:hypothetical protein